MKFKRLIEENINRIKKWKYYNNFDGFREEYPDHTFEFCWHCGNKFVLNTYLLIDETANYVHDNHPLFLYAEITENNNYILVPITIHKFQPFILDEKYKNYITNENFKSISKFITTNYRLLVEYSSGRIDYNEFEYYVKKRLLTESILLEMPTFRRTETRLPTEIWIDGDRNLKHDYRIKFNDKSNHDTNTWASMTISKTDPKTFNLADDTKLSPKDIKKIRNFVMVNYETLMLSAKGELRDRNDILSRLISDEDIKDLLKQENNVVNLDCSSIHDRIYFTADNKQIGKDYIKRISKLNLFIQYDEISVYLNNQFLKAEPYQEAEIIKNTLYREAKKMGVQLNLINTSSLLSYLDIIENDFKS